MKKNLLIFSIVLTTLFANSQDFLADPSVTELQKFTKEYFRSNPFNGEFSGFLQHLLNDPAIGGKTIKKRTDTSLYYFEGVYSKYNPFFFKPKRVEVILQEASQNFSDSLKVPDTIFIYQMIAYTNDDPKNEEDIKKEFDKIHRRNSRRFFSTNYQEVNPSDDIFIAMHNYFLALYWVAPVSTMRGKMKAENELFLNLTLRFKISGNRAILVAPFNNP